MARGKTSSAQQRVSPMIPVIGGLVVCGALFFVVAGSGRDGSSDPPPTSTSSTTTAVPEPTSSSVPVPDPVSVDVIATPPLPEEPPGSYRIVYDIIENGLERTETVIIRRPFESLVLSTRDDEVLTGTATSRQQLWTYLSDRDGWLAIQPQLHRAAFDQRPLAAMATMIAMGLAEEDGTASYLDRECRVFRTGGPLSDPGASPPSDEESTDVCIDANGLVLHERWEIGGQPVSERTAREVELDPELSDDLFDPSPVIEDAEAFEALLTSVAVPADDETLAGLQTDIVPPEGFELEGAVLRSGSAESGGTGVTEVVRFYSDGTDLLEVAEITALGGADLAGGGAVPVEIDGPETWFFADFRASAIRARLSDTRFVELRGTSPAQLVAVLDTLTRR